MSGNVGKKRDSNIELFRITTMLLIVAHHYVVNSGLMDAIRQAPWSLTSLFYLLFGAWGKTGINCFVLISGYYMCQAKLTPRRYLKLLLEVYYYRFLFFFIFLAAGRITLNASGVLHLLLPFANIGDGFTSCFLAFYLFIPFLNLLILHCRRRQHLAIIALTVFIYTVLPTVPTVRVTFNYVTWFIVVYLIGAYLRLYEPDLIMQRTGWKLIAAVFLAVVSVIILSYWSYRSGRDATSAYYLLSDSNKPLALLIAVLSFAFFRSLSIGYKQWINTMASTTFGVLLIHANSEAMRVWLWKETLKNQEMYGQRGFVLHAFLSVLGVFCVCSLLDLVRIRWIERPVMALYDRKEAGMICIWKRCIQKIKVLFAGEEL